VRVRSSQSGYFLSTTPSVTITVSLALSFFQDPGPGQIPGRPRINQIEGMTIIVAIFIVVCAFSIITQYLARSPMFSKVTVCSLNGWQNETQFHILLARDVALLLEPSEIIPCDGILKSGGRSVDEDEVKVIPPSPTLSTQSSIHFKSPQLFEIINPATDLLLWLSSAPKTTLALTPDGHRMQQRPAPKREPLPIIHRGFRTFTTKSAVETLSSPMPTHVDSSSDIGDPEKRMQKHKKTGTRVKGNIEGTPEEGDGNDEDKGLELDLTQDENIDPTPFAFKPYHLAFLVNPKNLEALETMGRTNGLLIGLGVDSDSGLGIGGKLSEPTEAPSVGFTDPTSEKVKTVEGSAHGGAAFNGTVEDRQRVYGPTTFPRKSKSLLELTWLALKNKVLVSPSHPCLFN